ncbi:unnamed protein product, partial [Symbiodinium necroappetens]
MLHATLWLNQIICSSAVTSCERAAKWQEALQLLHHMYHTEVLPDAITLNAAISACAKSGHWE